MDLLELPAGFQKRNGVLVGGQGNIVDVLLPLRERPADGKGA